jgi:hypothetical protein
MAHAGVPPVDASAVAPLNVEVRSIDYVPRSERHGKAWHLGAVWFVGNAELVSFATGPIGISLGLNFAWTAVAIVLGTLLGTLFMAFHSAQGPKLGLSQMIQSRAQFGYYGALLPIVAVLFVTIGYGVFDTVLGGEVFNATIRTTTKGSYVLFAVLALLLTVFGYQMIHRFSRWASLLYIVNFGLFTAIALANTHLASDQFSLSGASFQWGPFLIVLGALMSYNLTWAPYVSDYSRYLPADTPTSSTFTWTYWGAAIGTIWPATIGAFVGAAHPDLSPVQVRAITHRDSPILQLAFSGHPDATNMAAVCHEVAVWRAVQQATSCVTGVHVPASGYGFHCYLAVHKVPTVEGAERGEQRNAMLAAVGAVPQIKLAVAVDDDVDIYDDSAVIGALARRFQAVDPATGEQRLLVLPNLKGASYDPSSFHREYPNSKLLIDCTLRSDLSDEQRASFEEARCRGSDEIDLGEYLTGGATAG